ncbi:hypothetical protein pA_gene0072 [Vibrio phage 13VT501A]|nr:hypothetical protein pA_gene0072 [Vibrio phage 13VT501A]
MGKKVLVTQEFHREALKNKEIVKRLVHEDVEVKDAIFNAIMSYVEQMSDKQHEKFMDYIEKYCDEFHGDKK